MRPGPSEILPTARNLCIRQRTALAEARLTGTGLDSDDAIGAVGNRLAERPRLDVNDFHFVCRRGTLGNDIVHDVAMHVGEPEIAAGIAVGKPGVVQAH